VRTLIVELSKLLERSTPFQALNVDALKAEFIKLMKNVERVKDYREADALRTAIRTWRDHLDNQVFKLLVPAIHDHVQTKYSVSNADLWRPEFKYTKDEIDKWVTYWEKTVREAVYPVLHELLSFPLSRPDDSYWTHQKSMSGQWWASQGLDPDAEVVKGVFDEFKKKSPKWLAKVKRVATPAWKGLRDYLVWTESAGVAGRSVPALVPVRETVNLDIEGFKVRLVDFEDDDELHVTALARTRLALKMYRVRAAKVFPWLLQNPLPFHLETDCGLDWAGRYETNHIKLCVMGMNTSPNAGAHILAHEMGHHVWSVYCSREAAEFWRSAVSADRGTLDLVALQKVWKEGAPEGHLLDLEKVLENDPTLYLQVQTLTHGYGNYGKSIFFSLAELEALIASGTVQYPVPNNPITAYAAKNPEEAFCEAFGMLVGYGPRTVPPMVRQWLGVVLPSIHLEAAKCFELSTLVEAARALIAQDARDAEFARAGKTVDGLRVGNTVPNTGSIASSLTDYEVLDGIRSIPLSAFDRTAPNKLFYAANDIARAEKLARDIAESGWIAPLIVVQDSEGLYVLEGAHRLAALHILKKTHLPALLIIEL
jgi:hypothetical protein